MGPVKHHHGKQSRQGQQQADQAQQRPGHGWYAIPSVQPAQANIGWLHVNAPELWRSRIADAHLRLNSVIQGRTPCDRSDNKLELLISSKYIISRVHCKQQSTPLGNPGRPRFAQQRSA